MDSFEDIVRADIARIERCTFEDDTGHVSVHWADPAFPGCWPRGLYVDVLGLPTSLILTPCHRTSNIQDSMVARSLYYPQIKHWLQFISAVSSESRLP